MLTKKKIIASIAIALSCFTTYTAFSQESSISLATDIKFQEWQAVLHAPEGRVDRQVKVVDIGNSYVAVGVLFRDPIIANDQPVSGIVHTRVSEVYYITAGSGVLVTGGTMLSRNDIPENSDIVEVLVGESFSTSVARGDGQVRLVSEGDIVVVPAGVFHGWHEVQERVEMISIRPDPEKVLPAGYVNPYAE
jgi:mannose-6-phosphate isomerase-like protein (cupin superfamily)|tara:strand:- start:6193 stop:6768 length:576 start_codon:yes stop_codon:yes gene_type:complete